MTFFRPYGVLVAIALLSVAAAAETPRFLPDDPITREPDPYDASQVTPFPVHLAWDLLSGWLEPLDSKGRHAEDVNTIDEVPDSSWFTNRIGSRPLTPEDVARGPDVTSGPAAGPLTVVSGKSEGVRPGFTVRDTAGVRWFLKFDEPGYPEQATGAEVVATKLFWALGYNVAETHVATLRPENLVLDPAATITVDGTRRRLRRSDIDQVLAGADRSRDGSYRALASRALEGKPVGEFLYYGTRSDDPNDIIPHENRRELRAMRAFAAWIDRVDAKAGNTLDTLVADNGRTIVRHHVLDFGSTLGSAGIGPNEYWEGYEYLYQGHTVLKKLAGLGLPEERWRTIAYPRLRGIGLFEGDHFDPAKWKTRVPNLAYVRADADDMFWAARKVAAFSDAMIAAAVEAGQYSDPAARHYLTEALINRRNAIARTYLTAIDPIVDPRLDDTGRLTFQNAAVDGGVASGTTTYQASWYRFNNATAESVSLGDSTESRTPALPAPPAVGSDPFIRVDVSSVNPDHPAWREPVRIWFHRVDDAWVLVGLER